MAINYPYAACQMAFKLVQGLVLRFEFLNFFGFL